MAIGVPGWPESAAWIASMDSVRIVLMQRSSSGCLRALILGFLSPRIVSGLPTPPRHDT